MLSLTRAYLEGLTKVGPGLALLSKHVRTEYRLSTTSSYTVFGRACQPSISQHVRAKVEHESLESDQVDSMAAAAAQEAGWLEQGGEFVRLDDPVWKTNMSRIHMCIRRQADGSYQIFDMGSVNGVVLDGQRIPSRTWSLLAPGTLVRFSEGPDMANHAPLAEYEFVLEGQPRAHVSHKRKRSQAAELEEEAAAAKETKREEEEEEEKEAAEAKGQEEDAPPALSDKQAAFEDDHL